MSKKEMLEIATEALANRRWNELMSEAWADADDYQKTYVRDLVKPDAAAVVDAIYDHMEEL